MPAPSFVCGAFERQPAVFAAGFALSPRATAACARALAGAIASPSLLRAARVGGVAERLKAHAWKVCMRETVSRVRIPPPPPIALGA